MTTLALKYRPHFLKDLVGQEVSVLALTNTLLRTESNNGQINHQSFLFAGLRGTGKTSAARIFARALNCQKGPTPEPCGICDACIAAEISDQNLDIIEIDAASRSSVEDARALCEQIHTYPAFCRYRIYIIDEVHMLSRSAFDALLKILEEPPSHVVFILATTELQDIPDTIKSRVQIFPFRLIPISIIQKQLEYICTNEYVKKEDSALRLIAEAAQGSMRDAITILERIITAGNGNITELLVRDHLGIVSSTNINIILDAVLSGNTISIIDNCSKLISIGIDWISFWRELIIALRSRMEETLRINSDPHEALRWARIIQLLLQRERDLKDTNIPDVVVELALITAAQLPHLAPLSALLNSGNNEISTNIKNIKKDFNEISATQKDRLKIVKSDNYNSVMAKEKDINVADLTIKSNLPQETLQSNTKDDVMQLRKLCSEAFKKISRNFPRTFVSLPHMANNISLHDGILKLNFPNSIYNTAKHLDYERNNPKLIEQLKKSLPELIKIEIVFTEDIQSDDVLYSDPVLQRIIADTNGEIVSIRNNKS